MTKTLAFLVLLTACRGGGDARDKFKAEVKALVNRMCACDAEPCREAVERDAREWRKATRELERRDVAGARMDPHNYRSETSTIDLTSIELDLDHGLERCHVVSATH